MGISCPKKGPIVQVLSIVNVLVVYGFSSSAIRCMADFNIEASRYQSKVMHSIMP
jgi:hypothetical protein